MPPSVEQSHSTNDGALGEPPFLQPGFFAPRPRSPWLAPAGARDATSMYDTGPLRETLLVGRNGQHDQITATFVVRLHAGGEPLPEKCLSAWALSNPSKP